jgi:hypothetical protein
VSFGIVCIKSACRALRSNATQRMARENLARLPGTQVSTPYSRTYSNGEGGGAVNGGQHRRTNQGDQELELWCARRAAEAGCKPLPCNTP